MINSQNLIDKICARIACGGMTDLETCQTTNSLSILSAPVISVVSRSNLPSAAAYNGRMIYVDDENRYYHAVDGAWTNNFTSEAVNFNFALYAWGSNGNGRLGDNTSTTRSSPVSVVGGFTDWCQVAAGACHTAALRTNGSLWAWGSNGQGRLGDGTAFSCSRSSPVSVVGGFTDWCQVSVAGQHTAAVRTNGTAWAWGSNVQGRLGDNTDVNKSSPVAVVGGFTDWCQVAAGGYHTAAVRTNGTAWAWGVNFSGRLGDGTTTSRSSPVAVAGGFTDWCQVAAGQSHTAAVRTNGTAWAWGVNFSGRLGDGTTTARSSPVSVVGGFTDWCQVAAGFYHTAAVRTNGTAWSWGSNSSGQLGDGTATARSSPVTVAGGFTDWCQVAAGRNHTAAVRTNGTAWAWGLNAAYTQLGDGTATNRSSPVAVVGGFTDWCQVAAGQNHTAAVRVAKKGF